MPAAPAVPSFADEPSAPADNGLAELASLLESSEVTGPAAGHDLGNSKAIGSDLIADLPGPVTKQDDEQEQESYELNDVAALGSVVGAGAAEGSSGGGGSLSVASSAGGAGGIDALSASPIVAQGPVCPSCEKRLKSNAKICAACGIHIDTGRSLLTARDLNLNQIYTNTETTVRLLSWIIWLGFYPVASEAYGSRKPWTIRAITVVTILVSVWFYALHLTGSPQLVWAKNLMLWAGGAPPKAQMVAAFYGRGYGDTKALKAKMQEQAGFKPQASHAKAAEPSPAQPAMPEAAPEDSTTTTDAQEQEDDQGDAAIALSSGKELLEADKALPESQRAIGQFHWYQLITHALLHGGLMHLVGNLLFMLVFGSRVNAIMGNIATPIVYPLLAIGGAVGHLIDSANDAPMPMIGASGAIMGLAGMYLILVPGFNVHCVSWVRLGIFTGFRLEMKLFAVRGFWVVLFFIAFDVIYTLFGIKNGVAHWAHLGGFIAGMVIASGMVFSKKLDTRGGDLYSLILGRRAWGLVGKPSYWSAKREADTVARVEAEKAKALAKKAAAASEATAQA